jgi:CubicO group peptidase (beta-lactamase class C family)
MGSLRDVVDKVAAEHDFAGVVQVDRDGQTELCAAYGLADRRHQIPMAVDSQLALASGSKLWTALTVLSLVEEGRLDLDSPARTWLGGDLPLIADDVTVEQLLSHRSGIGDYLDEDLDQDLNDYLLPVPAQTLTSAEAFVPILGGYPTKFPAGERFSYCNQGYIVLALLSERVTGTVFHTLVRDRVSRPAGLTDTDFLRSDDLPARAALGYVLVDGSSRTNVFHLPVLGNGDGGIYGTVSDIHTFWSALLAGLIVSPGMVAELTRSRGPADSVAGYGLGIWLPSDDALMIVGCDAGVSFRSVCRRDGSLVHTVIGTDADCAWPVSRAVAEQLSD